jgi:hypothetical protein
MCVEVDKVRCLQIQRAYVFSKQSKTYVGVSGLAHIVFHSLCEQMGASATSSSLPTPASALPKKSARKKSRLNSNALGAIKAFAHNLFHKICEEYRHRSNAGGTAQAYRLRDSGRVTEDATIPQPRGRRATRPLRAAPCAQVPFA